MSDSNLNKTLIVGIITGSILTILSTSLISYLSKEKKEDDDPTTDIVEGVDGLIGNTPLMKIRSLSEATGCTILVSFVLSNEHVISIRKNNKQCREKQR
jgi:cysteine synthase A